MTRRLALWLMVLAGAAGSLSGQPPVRRGTRPATWAEWRVEGLTFRLGLSDAQKQQALALFAGVEQATQPLEEKLAQQRRLMRDATKSNATAQIDQLAATIGALTGQIAAIEAKGDASLYNLLTFEQKQKWDQAPSPGPGGGRGAGPGQGPRPAPGQGQGKDGHL
jgi:Spy/CpxP family protein refolding chaperone